LTFCLVEHILRHPIDLASPLLKAIPKENESMSSSPRTALITGSGSGMGLGVAKRLAAAGFRIAVNDIDPALANAAAAEIVGGGGEAVASAFDVTDADAARSAVQKLEEELGSVDILVNNAGNAGTHAVDQLSFRDMPIEHWQRYLGVNLYGVLNATKAVLDGMCERGWGRIITISSEAGRVGLDINVSVYGVAKAGASHLMRHLAREVGPNGVTCNTVALGLMDNVPDEFAGPIIRTIPARRLGTPSDVGGAVSFLTSDDAEWITGQTLVLNGGSFAF
jgi:3-oxoacyl-[acyl-carrier protein] reductase